jgi:uncharacterized protein (TIGR02466 family)
MNPILFNPFGAYLLKHKVPESVFNLLTQEIERIKLKLSDKNYVKENSHAEYLAGKNSYQVRLDYEVQKQINLESYLLSLGDFYLAQHNQNQHLQMGTTWINYTYSGDFNPLHTHDAILSGVIYIKQDESIYQEIKEFTGRNSHGKPGTTHFVHKLEMNRFDNNTYNNESVVGEVLLFPSWLTHYVNAHRCEGERITVAFNILGA